MTLALASPPCPPSLVRQWDPRWKLAALLCTILAISMLRTGAAVAVALGETFLLAALARLPWGWYATRIGSLALVLALFLLPLPFLLAGEGPTWDWGFVRVSPRGLTVGLVLAGKALAIVSLMLVLLATAPLDATLKAARSLGVPSLLIQLALLTYRYLFLLADELARLRIALRVRGYRNRANRHSYRTVAHVAGTLLVRGYERAERVGQAMRCRGFDGRLRTLTTFHTRAADLLAFLFLVLTAAGIWWLDRCAA